MSVLVMGVGNVLLTDEGVGVKAVRELEKYYSFSDDVEILDGGTAGIELLSYISNREHLIIIDVMTDDQDPGTVMRLEGKDVPAAFMTRISPHQLGLSDLLAAAILTEEMPKNIVLFGIEPADLGTGLELSEVVSANFDKLINSVIDELLSIGCKVEERDEPLSRKSGDRVLHPYDSQLLAV